jgi:hypothetical protein
MIFADSRFVGGGGGCPPGWLPRWGARGRVAAVRRRGGLGAPYAGGARGVRVWQFVWQHELPLSCQPCRDDHECIMSR